MTKQVVTSWLQLPKHE